jgi:hypothetical protein
MRKNPLEMGKNEKIEKQAIKNLDFLSNIIGIMPKII